METAVIILWSVLLAFYIACTVFKLYDKIWWLDLVVHFVAGVVISMTLTLFTKSWLLIFTSAVTLSLAWELIEFLCDSIFGTNMQRWKDSYTRFKRGGLIDSMTDLIAAIVGIGLAVALFGLLI